ncbi:hypothetical protein COOONC_25777 [Cooperia oncophora]
METRTSIEDYESSEVQPLPVNPLLLEVLRSQSGASAKGDNYAASVIVERETNSGIDLEVPDNLIGFVLGPGAKTIK